MRHPVLLYRIDTEKIENKLLKKSKTIKENTHV